MNSVNKQSVKKIIAFLKKYSLIVKIILSFVILYSVLRIIHPAEILQQLKNISHPLLLIPAFLLLYVNLSIMARKWRLLFDIKMTISKITWLYWASDFMNLFFLGAVGGEIYKAIFTKNKRLTITSSLLDRLLSLGVYAFIALIVIIFHYSFPIKSSFQTVFIGIIIIALLLIIYTNIPFILSIISKYTNVFAEISINKKNSILHFFYTLLFLSVTCVIYYFIFLAFNVSVPFINYLILAIFIIIGLTLPISIQGIGIREFIFLSFAQISNINPGVALAASFSLYILELLYKLTGTIPYFQIKKKI